MPYVSDHTGGTHSLVGKQRVRILHVFYVIREVIIELLSFQSRVHTLKKSFLKISAIIYT